jgi:hypothetical protein
MPVGAYEVTVEAANFSKYARSGITLALNHAAVVDVTMKLGGVSEVVTTAQSGSDRKIDAPRREAHKPDSFRTGTKLLGARLTSTSGDSRAVSSGCC